MCHAAEWTVKRVANSRYFTSGACARWSSFNFALKSGDKRASFFLLKTYVPWNISGRFKIAVIKRYIFLTPFPFFFYNVSFAATQKCMKGHRIR